ncbi:MAG: hypothetical protein HY741_15340 [Chloroflexi bacterium]|nr:hypothetical protein [Chloroflexota bacterium]
MPAKTLRRALKLVQESRADPLEILATTANVIQHAQFVTLDLRRIRTVARVLSLRPVPVPGWNFEYHFCDGTARTVMYVFLLDALNFSFWGDPKWCVQYVRSDLDGYWALAAALKRAAERDASFLDAENLAALAPETLARVLRGNVEIPLFVERWRNVQELGRVLRDHFGGSAARLVEQANGDAAQLARLVAQNVSSFNDTTLYKGRAVNFFKRAQILAGDLYGSFGGEKWGAFHNLQDLTAFADYKLPQILRAWGILNYAPELARRVDRKIPLAKDSPHEIEIRAAMVWAVELLRHALAQHDRVLNSVQMDWFLWQSSQATIKGMKPYHRVRTIYY